MTLERGRRIHIWDKLLDEVNSKVPFSCKILQIFVMEKYISKIFYNEICTSLGPLKMFPKFGTMCTGKNIVQICIITYMFSKVKMKIHLFVSIKIFLTGLLPDLSLQSNSHNAGIVISRLIPNIFILSLTWETSRTYQILSLYKSTIPQRCKILSWW